MQDGGWGAGHLSPRPEVADLRPNLPVPKELNSILLLGMELGVQEGHCRVRHPPRFPSPH